MDMRPRCLAAALLALGALLGPTAGRAQTVTVAIPAERDTTLMQAHPHDGDGAWGFLWPKWNGDGLDNRVLVGFDLGPLAGRAADVLAARLRLRAADHTFTARGSRLDAHLVQPDATIDWVEGDGRWDTFAYCSRRDLRRAATGPGAPGATWTCEDEAGAAEGAPACVTPWAPPTAWAGGLALPDEASAHLPRGARAAPSATTIERTGYDPLCRKALDCFAATGSSDCWRLVVLDVTADVREVLAVDHLRPSWLLRKPRIEAGAAHFFSREGAVCILRIPDLRPQLHVTLVARAGDPPVIPEPPDHCEAVAR
jgi:hypothetical protein